MCVQIEFVELSWIYLSNYFSLLIEHSKFIIPKSYNYIYSKKKKNNSLPFWQITVIIQRIQNVVFN